MLNSSIPHIINNNNEWTGHALTSCQILKWIGIYLIFTFIAGIVLNITILSILLRNKYKRSPIDIFIIALCFSDLLATLLGIPLPLTSNLACRWLYGKYLCYYEGFIAYFVGMVGLYLLTTLSFNRYWIMVKQTKSQSVTFQTAYRSIVLSILGGLFWALAPVFGWNDYKLEGVRTSCSINWQDRTFNVISYNILLFIFAYTLPLIIMVYCNLQIYFKVHVTTQNQIIRDKSLNSMKLYKKKQKIDQRTAKIVFLIIITFVIAWTPYAIVAFTSSFFSSKLIAPLGGTIPAIFAKSTVYFNPLVYIMSNSSFRSKLFNRQRNTKHIYTNDSSKNELEQIMPLKITRFPLLSMSK